MNELYVGIDPSINSTGISLVLYIDSKLSKEMFYIIKPNKLTKKEQKFENDHNDLINYIIYEKISDSEDSHELERKKTLNLIHICEQVINIINTFASHNNVKHNNIYVAMEGLSYGSAVRTRSIYELAGLNYLIRYHLISNFSNKNNIFILPPTEVKKFATGIGNCSKDAMINIFKNIYVELSDMPKIDDIADAWFICNYIKTKDINDDYDIDKNKIKEIDKRIERHQKEYISKMRDTMRKEKDFEMTN